MQAVSTNQIAELFFLLSKVLSPRSKALINFASLCYGHVNTFYSIQEGQSFFRIVETVEQFVRTSFNFTFSTTAEGVESILKTVFELLFYKMT